MLNFSPSFEMLGYQVGFERFWAYYLLPVMIALILLPYFLTPKKKRRGIGHIVALVSRCITMVAATVILSGLTFTQIQENNKEVSMVIVVDYSKSVDDITDQMDSYVRRLITDTNESTAVSIVKFAGDQIVATPEFTKNHDIAIDLFNKSGGELVETNESTDLASAIRLGTELLKKQNTHRQLVVVSDGRETRGSAVQAAAEAAAADIRVDTVAFDIIKTEGYAEVAIMKAEVLPNNVMDAGKNATMSFNVYSSIDVKGTLSFYFDDETTPREIRPVSLIKGNNPHHKTYNTTENEVGVHELRVVFEPENKKDSIKENNELSTWIKLNGKPNVLIIGGDTESMNKVATQVSSIYDVTMAPLSGDAIPMTMQDLLRYDEVILMNVTREELLDKSPQFDVMLERFVYNVGRGLFTTTGTSEGTYMSYGGDNWSEADTSPLARMLPIKMTLDETLFNTAIILVIDDSSSMLDGAYGTVDKFEPAKEGAKKVIEALGEHDYVGIVTFHQEATMHLDLTKPTNKDELYELVDNLSAENHFGTDYSKGLDMAREMLKSFNDARSKHVIFITDGYPTRGEYENIPTYMKNAGIKLHTIAMLTDQSAKDLLKGMADKADGNTYSVDSTDDLETVADVMKGWTEDAKEPEFINTEPFNPLVGDDTGVLNMVQASEMTLGGYIGSTLKDGAEMPLHTKDFRPLIAEWDYGRGHVTSVLTDMTGEWGSAIFSEENNGYQLVKNLVKQSLNSEVSVSGITASVTQVEEKAYITVKSTYAQTGVVKVDVIEKTLTGYDEKNLPAYTETVVQSVELKENNSEYIGGIDTPDPCRVYEFKVTLHDKATNDVLDQTRLAHAGGVIAEYDIFNIDGESIMKGIANAGDGELMPNDAHSKVLNVNHKNITEEAYTALLPCAIVLCACVFLDIVIRHVNFDRIFRRKKNVEENSTENPE